MASTVSVILDMMVLVIENTLGTIFSLLSLLGELVSVSGAGGGFFMIISVVLISVVVFFTARFIFGSIRTVILLTAAAVVFLILTIIGTSLIF